MQSVHTLLKLAQLRWTGHITRIPDERLPKKVLYGELQEGKRSQGGQKKRYKDTFKASLKDFNIPIESWEQAAQAVHDPIRLNLEPSPDFMVVLLTCKNEDDSIKNEGARVFITLNIDFSDAQW